MSTILLLLEPGSRIKRFDHVHPLRACHLNLWGRTFPGAKWRCGACMQDFDFEDPNTGSCGFLLKKTFYLHVSTVKSFTGLHLI